MRVLIADDEPLARQRMRDLLRECGGTVIVAETGDGLETLAAVERTRPEVLLLDIDMPGLDGLGVAETLGQAAPAIIFVTAHDAHAVKAFELAAIDYLLKPTRLERLRGALERAAHARAGADVQTLLRQLRPDPLLRRLGIKCGDRFHIFDPARVSALLAAPEGGTTVLIDDRELLADESLDALQTKLDGGVFFRTHRSACINLTFVSELRREGDRQYAALLSDARRTRAPISRDRLPALKTLLGLSP